MPPFSTRASQGYLGVGTRAHYWNQHPVATPYSPPLAGLTQDPFQQFPAGVHRLPANVPTVPVQAQMLALDPLGGRDRDPYRTHRLATMRLRAGHAGRGNGDIGLQESTCRHRHGLGDRPAHDALGKNRRVEFKDGGLDRLVVSHHPAAENVRAARNIRRGCGHETCGQRLGGAQRPPSPSQSLDACLRRGGAHADSAALAAARRPRARTT